VREKKQVSVQHKGTKAVIIIQMKGCDIEQMINNDFDGVVFDVIISLLNRQIELIIAIVLFTVTCARGSGINLLYE